MNEAVFIELLSSSKKKWEFERSLTSPFFIPCAYVLLDMATVRLFANHVQHTWVWQR